MPAGKRRLQISKSRQGSSSRYLPNLRRAQRKVAQHPARFKVLACGRRWGKTTLGMVMAVRRALDGQRVWWVAPTYGLAFHPWRGFKGRFAITWDQKIESDRHIDLASGGSITIKTAENPDGLRGVGVGYVVVDEAAFIAEEVWTGALRPALADRQGEALFLSTPRGRNWFYRAYQTGQDPLNKDWQSWRYPTAANPLIAPAEIAAARREQPVNMFRQEYLAHFLWNGGMVFRRIYEAATVPHGRAPVKGRRYVMGLDFARYEDFTVAIIIDADSKEMVAMDRFTEATWELQRKRIIALAKKWDVWDILAEANAMGEPNIEALYRAGLRIRRFTTTAQSKPPLIEGLVAAIENGDLRILNDEVLLGELGAYSYRTSPAGHTVYEAPPGSHDDCVMALALAWKSASRPRIALAVAVV